MLDYDSKQLFKLGLEALTHDNHEGRKKATEYFTQAQAKDSPYAPASFMLGQIYETESRNNINSSLEPAFQAYAKAIEIDKTFIAAWMALERCYRLGFGAQKSEELADHCKKNIQDLIKQEKKIVDLDEGKSCVSSSSHEKNKLTLSLNGQPPLTYSYSSCIEKMDKQDQKNTLPKEEVVSPKKISMEKSS